jgi:hypothetical protein
VNLRKDHSCRSLNSFKLILPTAAYNGYFALEMSGAEPRKDAVNRDIQPESQNC